MHTLDSSAALRMEGSATLNEGQWRWQAILASRGPLGGIKKAEPRATPRSSQDDTSASDVWSNSLPYVHLRVFGEGSPVHLDLPLVRLRSVLKAELYLTF